MRIWVRPALLPDKDLFVDYLAKTINNSPDSDILTYPSTTIRCAYDDKGPLIFIPLQRPIHLESLAIRPNATNKEIIQAIRALFADIVTSAHTEGSGEIWFEASNKDTEQFAINHGFKKSKYPVYKIKVKDLCQQNQSVENSTQQ